MKIKVTDGRRTRSINDNQVEAMLEAGWTLVDTEPKDDSDSIDSEVTESIDNEDQ